MFQNIKTIFKENYILIIIATIFFLIYSALSLVKHYNFQSSAYDLGIFNQTLYSYAHFSLGPNTLRHVNTLLGDHFEPILFLFAPFYFLFGSYTLLIIQIIAIVLGGIGVYKLVQEHTHNKNFSIISSILFYSTFGIFQALAFDYHNNVVGAMAIPWILYYFLKRNYIAYYILFALFLLCKETMGLVGIMIGLSIIIFDRKQWKHGLITLSLCIFWSFITISILIPLFNNNGNHYDHWQSFNNLGTSPTNALYNIFIHPKTFILRFFDNPIKLQMWQIIIMSGGVFAIFYPRYSILILPIIAQKFLAQNQSYWEYYFHYNIELVIIISIASSIFLFQNIKNIKLKYFLLISLCIINIGYSFKLEFYDNSNLFKIFNYHYYSNPERNSLNEAIAIIPDNSAVIAQNHIIPHLTNRPNINSLPYFDQSETNTNPDKTYQCPKLANHEFLILNLADESVWPMTSIEQVKQIIVHGYENNKDIKKIYDNDGIVLYQTY